KTILQTTQKMSSLFILHFKPFLGHFIIPRIKNTSKLFSFNREAINHFKISFSTFLERKMYFFISIALLNKKLKPKK
ncbi:hypothetical protein ACIGCI_12460, partial [Staphylococcus capitis]|uniref:hypothetical protein n=2 Tax=Bacillales TaxID=1385 RepID=UPI0037D856E6